MSEELLLPKFLTWEVAEAAINAVLKTVFDSGLSLAKRKACHVVVLVPSMVADRGAGYPNYPRYPIEPHLLGEVSLREDPWTGQYNDIAQCKALQEWQGRNDDRTDIMPHLLFPGDTRFWGAVKRYGIVVACSGIQPWLDKTISGMSIELMVGMAYEAYMQSDDYKNGVSFLTASEAAE